MRKAESLEHSKILDITGKILGSFPVTKASTKMFLMLIYFVGKGLLLERVIDPIHDPRFFIMVLSYYT